MIQVGFPSAVFLVTNRLTGQQNFKVNSEIKYRKNLPAADFFTFPSEFIEALSIYKTPSSQSDNTSCRELKEVRGADAGHLALNLSKYFECLA